ncbi:MAG: hypothetical protein ABIP55_10500, partial [Tepidisphaeraceae bacterium]
AIDPAAAIFLALFVFAVPALRWRWPMKLGGLLLFALGAAGPILLHVSLARDMGVSVIPTVYQRQPTVVTSAPATTAPDDLDDAARTTSSWWNRLGDDLLRLFAALFGDHGILTHFPILLLGGFGVAAVMHRHWPATTKVLATATVAGGTAIILFFCLYTLAGPGQMFGPQAFIVFLPLFLFWSGAWMRRPHHAVKWSLAACLLLFSIAVTILGATNPTPRDGYDRYTVAQALSALVQPTAMQAAPVFAGR